MVGLSGFRDPSPIGVALKNLYFLSSPRSLVSGRTFCTKFEDPPTDTLLGRDALPFMDCKRLVLP